MEIPSEIKAFKHLKVLYLGGNLLTELPSTICQLKKVRALILCQNRLRSLPNCICKLQSLECLQLHQVFWLEFREMYSFNKYFRYSFFPTRMNWQPFHMAWSLSTVWKSYLWGTIHWWCDLSKRWPFNRHHFWNCRPEWFQITDFLLNIQEYPSI